MSCILYHNPSLTVTIIDIPRSIELAQGVNHRKRLLSTIPIEKPFPSLEPKSSKAKANLGDHSVEDLLVQKHLEFALSEITEQYQGEWCLPRIIAEECESLHLSHSLSSSRKRKSDASLDEEIRTKRGKTSASDPSSGVDIPSHLEDPITMSLYKNTTQHQTTIDNGPGQNEHLLPPHSIALCGEIERTQSLFTSFAPKFDLILMDPPWPNRSARRKSGYGISFNKSEIESLLRSIPLENHLKNNGYVGIWITNKSIFRELVLELFTEWGLTHVEEGVWLKVTSQGDPICALDGLWRKPYEIFLLARKGAKVQDVQRRVLVGVPDLHSRKPNLKFIFEKLAKKKGGEYQALEVFARNMTEGWWSWGNEAMKFQEAEYWAVVEQKIPEPEA